MSAAVSIRDALDSALGLAEEECELRAISSGTPDYVKAPVVALDRIRLAIRLMDAPAEQTTLQHALRDLTRDADLAYGGDFDAQKRVLAAGVAPRLVNALSRLVAAATAITPQQGVVRCGPGFDRRLAELHFAAQAAEATLLAAEGRP